MAAKPSDAIVFFGATGDLAYKQVFSSLLGFVRDEGLNISIIGVAEAGWRGPRVRPCFPASDATRPIPILRGIRMAKSS